MGGRRQRAPRLSAHLRRSLSRSATNGKSLRKSLLGAPLLSSASSTGSRDSFSNSLFGPSPLSSPGGSLGGAPACERARSTSSGPLPYIPTGRESGSASPSQQLRTQLGAQGEREASAHGRAHATSG